MKYQNFCLFTCGGSNPLDDQRRVPTTQYCGNLLRPSSRQIKIEWTIDSLWDRSNSWRGRCSRQKEIMLVFQIMRKLMLTQSILRTAGSDLSSYSTCLLTSTLMLLTIFSPVETISFKMWERPRSWNALSFAIGESKTSLSWKLSVTVMCLKLVWHSWQAWSLSNWNQIWKSRVVMLKFIRLRKARKVKNTLLKHDSKWCFLWKMLMMRALDFVIAQNWGVFLTKNGGQTRRKLDW